MGICANYKPPWWVVAGLQIDNDQETDERFPPGAFYQKQQGRATPARWINKRNPSYPSVDKFIFVSEKLVYR
jgi:hypothetical protein